MFRASILRVVNWCIFGHVVVVVVVRFSRPRWIKNSFFQSYRRIANYLRRPPLEKLSTPEIFSVRESKVVKGSCPTEVVMHIPT